MRQQSRRPVESGVRTRWTGFRPFFDYWGNEIKRFYQLETLANATDHMLIEKDRFILPSVQEVLGPPEISSLAFELFQEGRFQLIFRVKAGNVRKKQGAFGMVVAKNAEECSTVARNEHNNLRTLHERAPMQVVKTYRGGAIHLPDRHQRTGKGRDIYAYLTQWLQGYDELGINKNLQCIANTLKVHTFTKSETETIKGLMVETVFRSYDPKSRTCMAMPEIASGDFVINWSRKDNLRLKLIACRRLINSVDSSRVLAEVMKASWEWGGQRFYLVPDEPETLLAALERVVGKDRGETVGDAISSVRGGQAGTGYPIP